MVISFVSTLFPLPYLLNITQSTCRATLSWRFLFSFWASSCIQCAILCQTHWNVHTIYMCGVSEIVSMLFLIKFVPNACSCAASIRPSVSFFKSPFLSHGLQPKYWYHQSNFLHSVLINTTSWLFFSSGKWWVRKHETRVAVNHVRFHLVTQF